MTEHKIGEVFPDNENFDEPKKIKCVETENDRLTPKCYNCVYDGFCMDMRVVPECVKEERYAEDDVYFIETDQPLTTEDP